MTDNIDNFINKKISLIIDDDEESIIQLSDIINERFSDCSRFDVRKNNLYDYWADCKQEEAMGISWALIFIDEFNDFNAYREIEDEELRQKMTAKEILKEDTVKEITENEMLDLFEV